MYDSQLSLSSSVSQCGALDTQVSSSFKSKSTVVDIRVLKDLKSHEGSAKRF